MQNRLTGALKAHNSHRISTRCGNQRDVLYWFDLEPLGRLSPPLRPLPKTRSQAERNLSIPQNSTCGSQDLANKMPSIYNNLQTFSNYYFRSKTFPLNCVCDVNFRLHCRRNTEAGVDLTFRPQGATIDDGPLLHWAGVTQLVECDLAKVDVAGSNPVSRSILRFPPFFPNTPVPRPDTCCCVLERPRARNSLFMSMIRGRLRLADGLPLKLPRDFYGY